ncbi:MAG: hypothetical protein ACI3YE_08205 [Candidatus Avispirillum sp.]
MREKAKKRLCAVCCVAAAVLPAVLRYVLTYIRLPEGTLLYHGSGFWGTAALVALCAVSAVSAYYLTRPSYRAENDWEEEPDGDVGISNDAGGAQTGTDGVMYDEYDEKEDYFGGAQEDYTADKDPVETEYGELYIKKPEGETPKAKRPDIACAISAQKVSADMPCGDPEDGEDGKDGKDGEDGKGVDDVQRAWEDFLGESEKQDDSVIRELYENIPDTLPEGYGFTEEDGDGETCYDAFGEDEENEDNGDGEDGDAARCDGFLASPRARLIKKGAAAVLIAAALCLAALMSGVYTAVGDGGVTVSGAGGGKSYGWSDAEYLQVEMSALSEKRLTVKAFMTDGDSVTVCSSSFYKTAYGAGAGDSEIALCARIIRAAHHSGAEIRAIDAERLSEAFTGSDDAGYIQEIISLNN